MIPSISLCLRNVIVDFAGYHFDKPEEKDWMVAFVCHLLPAMVSGYFTHLPPMNEHLSINEDRPFLKIRGLETGDLAVRLMNGVSLDLSFITPLCDFTLTYSQMDPTRSTISTNALPNSSL
jgi:hypothetical protein